MATAEPNTWLTTPAARRAIAAVIAADERATIRRQQFARTRDEWRSYDGPLAAAVERARQAWIDAQGGDPTALHFAVISTDDAIDAAYQAAACDDRIAA